MGRIRYRLNKILFFGSTLVRIAGPYLLLLRVYEDAARRAALQPIVLELAGQAEIRQACPYSLKTVWPVAGAPARSFRMR